MTLNEWPAGLTDYVTARLPEDPHLWVRTLLDELRPLGFAASYPTLTRQIRTRSPRPGCSGDRLPATVGEPEGRGREETTAPPRSTGGATSPTSSRWNRRNARVEAFARAGTIGRGKTSNGGPLRWRCSTTNASARSHQRVPGDRNRGANRDEAGVDRLAWEGLHRPARTAAAR